MIQSRIAFTLALLSFGFFTVAANAQTVSKPPLPSIAIVDVERVMRDSVAVKSARSQIDVIAKDLQKGIAEEEETLRAEERTLQQQRAILSPEKYAEKRQVLQQRAAKSQQRARNLRQSIDRGIAQTMQRIQIVLFEEIGKLAEEMGVNLVLPRSQIVVAVEPFNISKLALERLNARLTKVDIALEPNEKK